MFLFSIPQCTVCILTMLYLALILSLLLSISRWGYLTTLTVTYFNSTLSPDSSALLNSQLLAIGNLLAQTCRMMQFVALIYGVTKFKSIFACNESIKIFKKACKDFCAFKNNSCTLHTLILLGVILFYCVKTWSVPIMLTVWFPEFALWHDDVTQQHPSTGYTVLAWHHHISDMVIRLAMGASTRLVVVAWSAGIHSVNKLELDIESQKTLENFTEMVKQYKETGKVVAALQDVWFVMSWVVTSLE